MRRRKKKNGLEEERDLKLPREGRGPHRHIRSRIIVRDKSLSGVDESVLRLEKRYLGSERVPLSLHRVGGRSRQLVAGPSHSSS